VADPEAQARRADRRFNKVQRGVEALANWLEDIVRQGLGDLQGKPASFWQSQAARMTDAQARGLRRWVLQMSTIPSSGEDWPERLLDRLSRLYLLLEAFGRLEDLPRDLQEEIRVLVGWTYERDELCQQEGERDHWLVLGWQVFEEDQLRARRTWLWGMQGRRSALLLDFAQKGRAFEDNYVLGSELDAELVFWPSSFPTRALIKEQHGIGMIQALPGYTSLKEALAAYGSALARNPWLDPFLLPLEAVVPLQYGEFWMVRDIQSGLLSLSVPDIEGWRLLALSGGHPIGLVGVWDGRLLYPVSAWTGGALTPIGGQA
jgi:hypothetical protein